jgi:hypothetical protein
MIKAELFISKDCPHCPPAAAAFEKVINKHFAGLVEGELVILDTPEGKKRAHDYNLQSMPVLVINGEVMEPGVDEAKVYHAIMLFMPKPSFFERIFGKK